MIKCIDNEQTITIRHTVKISMLLMLITQYVNLCIEELQMYGPT